MEPTHSELDPATAEIGDDGPLETLLDGKYRIVKEIGAGGMGVVYEGLNVGIGRRVAIKMLHQCYAGHAEAVERFELEARAAAPISHPSIVDVLDMGRTAAGVPFIVMEHLEGEGLYQRLTTRGTLPPSDAVTIAVQVLGALSAAHAVGIVHRDVKPENVFLVHRGERDEAVKILDFGVAAFSPPRRTTAGRLTAAGIVVGTPGYMSPEQSQGGDVDARSDLYSVGVLIYELLTGRLPRGPEGRAIAVPILQILPGLPPELAAVIGKAHHRVPASRYQTANELIEALRPFEHMTGDAGVPRSPTPSAGPPSRPDGAAAEAEVSPQPRPASANRRRPALSGWLGLVLTAALSIAAIFVYRHIVDAPLLDRGPRVVTDRLPSGLLRSAAPHPSVMGVQASADEPVVPPPLIEEKAPVEGVPAPAGGAVTTEVPAPPRVGRIKPVLPFRNVY